MKFSSLKLILLVGLFNGCFVHLLAQDPNVTATVESLAKRSNYGELFPLYNAENKETAVFLEDQRGKAFDLFLVHDTDLSQFVLRGETPKLRIPSFTGAMYADSMYTAYFVDEGNFMLGTTTFDLKTETFKSQTNNLDLKRGEKVLTKFTYNGLFYFVVLKKETSNISFHTYKHAEALDKHTIELKDANFPHFLRDNLYNCVAYNNGKMKTLGLLNPLYTDQESDYFIQQDGVFYMVVNTNKVVKINLENYEAEVIDVPVNYIESNENYKKSVLKNILKKVKTKSTVYDNLFFRVNIVKKDIRLQVYDLDGVNNIVDMEIVRDSIQAKTIYDSPFRRTSNFLSKENLLFDAIKTGEFGFRVVKTDDGNYNIHLGKVATNDFWDIFDTSSQPNERSDRLGFEEKFVGIFSDYKGNDLNTNLMSPFFSTKDIQSRYLEFTFNKEQGILPVTDEEKESEAKNRFTRFTENVSHPVYNEKLNGFFTKNNHVRFVQYNPNSKQLDIYDL